MAFLTHATVLLILACVSHQLVLGSGSRGNGRRSPRALRQTKSLQPIKGKVVTKDKMECTWAASGDETFTMGVTCKKKGGLRVSCDYVARPKLCPQYSSNPNLFWKQIGRSLRKQRSLCQDSGAMVKAGMCRRAPRDAHFRLRKTDRGAGPRISLTPSPPAVRSCQRTNKRLAQEYCAHNWSSFCTFFFTMIQDQDC